VRINLHTKLFVSKDLSSQTPRKHGTFGRIEVKGDLSDLITSWTLFESCFLEDFYRIFANRSLFESMIDSKFATVFFQTPLILK
jgi:hypothetical protein